MNTTKGKPILGAILGALAALVFILILAIGGIQPPDQFVVWTLLGLGVLVGALMLTVALKSVKFVTIMVIAVVMVVWGAVGASSHFGTGYLDGGCELEGLSSDGQGLPLDLATPEQTSANDPFEIASDGTIDWKGTTPGGFEGWDAWLKVDFGGFRIPVWENTNPNTGLSPAEEGMVDVGGNVTDIEDKSGLTLSGVFELYGSIESQDGVCDMSAYIVLPPDGIFSGPILITLWIILAVIVIVLVILMIPVCAAHRANRAARAAGVAAAASSTAGAKVAASGADATAAPAKDAATQAGADAPDTGEGAKAAPKKAPAKKPSAGKAPAKKPPTKK